MLNAGFHERAIHLFEAAGFIERDGGPLRMKHYL
jgi:hypothetical protein